MSHAVLFMAQCLHCIGATPVPFTAYDDRADWVGAHRVSTGHKVSMWIATPPQ